MAWSWLALLVCFVLPLLVYIAAYPVLPRLKIPHKQKVPALLAALTAVLSSLAVVVLIFSSPYWRDGTRIVWSGMQAHGEPLVIGGRYAETATGWPNGATAPKLKVVPQPDSPTGTFEISGGGAFIFDEQSQRFLNGKPVAVGSTATFGDYQIRINHLGWGWKFWQLFSPEVEILDLNGQKMAGFPLRPNRTRPLRYLLAGNVIEPLTHLEKIADREKLEDWASNLWLTRVGDQEIYVLTNNDTAASKINLPARLTVKWVNLTLPITIGADGRNTTLDFISPWRLSSPLPPAQIEGCAAPKNKNPNTLNLTATARPQPCDAALVLPFSQLAGDVRQALTIDAGNHKFNSQGALDCDAPSICPPGVKCETRCVGTSQVAVQGNAAFTFYLNTVRDLPSRKGILALLFLSFIMFVIGIALAYPRMPVTNRWVIYGIVTAIWLFLSLRLALAFRYVLDPAALDKLSINGVTRSFIGLMIVPGLLLLWARLRCDRYEAPGEKSLSRQAILYALYYVLGLLLCGLCALYFPSRLWSGLPSSYHYSMSDLVSLQGMIFLVLLGLILLLLALHIRFRYRPDSKKILLKYFVESWYWGENFVVNSQGFWARHLNRRPARMLRFIGLVILFSGILLLGLFLLSTANALPGDKTAQELIVPLVFYCLAILWIGLKLHLQAKAGTPLSKWQVGWLLLSAILLISVPAIAVPFAIIDFGSILPVLAILLPLIAILLAGRSLTTALIFLGSSVALLLAGMMLPALITLLLFILGLVIGLKRSRHPLRAGLAAAFGGILLFGLGGLFYQNLEGMILPNAKYYPGLGRQGRVFARLLNYKKGSLAQQYAILANNVAGGEGLPYQELLNGNQHTWENKAIAHEGGWFGLGFGEAPVQRSHVRRDTLQYDSVFSFFIVSEYGFLGSLLLLLLYVCPLLIIFIGGRERFDAGYALALIVASAFLIESLYHAGMNWGAFPMSGRNLPLLSVNSPSDLLRWTLLWGFAIHTIFWRYEAGGQIKDTAASLIANSEEEKAHERAGDEDALEEEALPQRASEPWWPYAIVVWLIPVLITLSVLINGLGVLREKREFERFNYEVILNDVRWYLENGIITFDQQAKKLELRTEKLDDPDTKDFIQQEVERFNARTEKERREEVREQLEAAFEEKLKKITSVREYQQLLKEISNWQQSEPKRSIFRLVPLHDERGRIENYQVTTNPDFNVSYSFKVGLTASDLPKMAYGKELLLAPAWVSGRYQTAINPNAPLPWVAYLRDALEAEWLNLRKEDPTKAPKLYGALTLDPLLHEAALKFTATNGMKLHELLLRRNQGGEDNYADKLPPRVALSIISLPNGETLALGGWPRMTSVRDNWEQGLAEVDNGQQEFWVPSSRWIEREASQSLSIRYRGDRNFDRSLVMGSSTKPLWAAAVLKLHPKLSDYLQIVSDGTEESDVFGLKIAGKPWDLNGHSTDWLGFRNYLKQSDNRYHIRLGFLGLAEKNGSGSIKDNGLSPSRNESLTGDKRPWGRYPQFLPSIKISQKNPPELLTLGPNPSEPNAMLADSEFAQALRGMFSIGMKQLSNDTGRRREFSFRRSFWTRNENDDLNAPVQRVTSLFNQIAPEAPDFAFDKLYKPRDYVTMLLGGGNNLWANVDFAAAFGSCLTGHPVIAHITRGESPVQTLTARNLLNPDIAYQIRFGLKDVVETDGGTAYRSLSQSRALEKFKGFNFYAKTGTLKVEEDSYATSRIVLAIVKWKNDKKGEVEAGLVFSVVAEQGGEGTAAVWLNKFILMNADAIFSILKNQK